MRLGSRCAVVLPPPGCSPAGAWQHQALPLDSVSDAIRPWSRSTGPGHLASSLSAVSLSLILTIRGGSFVSLFFLFLPFPCFPSPLLSDIFSLTVIQNTIALHV